VADQALLLRTLSEFAHTLVRRYQIGDVLYELVARVAAVVGVAGAGVSLGEGDRVRFVSGLNEASIAVEHAQEQGQDGPCTEAYRTGQIVLVRDLGALEASRWEQYRAAALNAGFRGVAAIPMRVDGHLLGALNIYAAEARDWPEDDLAAAQVLADMATSYIINASELAQAQRTAEQLSEALESRVVIEQAKGLVAADFKVSLDQAFETIRRHARQHSASVRSVAEAVVNLGLRPSR
jgi:GAF domain-containing protein